MEQPTDAIEPLARLTERERLVASKSAEGLTYREIADELFIAPNTVRTHLSKIYKKLGIRNKAALIYLLNQTPQDNVNAPVSRIALPPPACPYPGMVPFRAEDAAYFYGREAEIQQMVQHLRQQQFLMIIGPSGSGKSSLVYAGLLPALDNSRYFDKHAWLIRTLRLGANPTAHLAALLTTDMSTNLSDTMIQTLLQQHPPTQRLLLLIDQFEEIFTQTDRREQHRFMALLQTLRTTANCTLLLTMRADFYPELMTCELWPVDASQRVEVAPLRGETLRAAIEKPATAVGVRLEESLVNQLLADAAEEPGVLPLLQETMSQLWLEMEQRVLSYAAYEKLSRNGASTTTDSASSGLAVAIASKADHTLAELKPPQQLIARRIFLRLIQFGEGRADTRRQQPVSTLQALGDHQNDFDRTLEHLTDYRLLTLSGDEEQDDSRVDIAHESLIIAWARLQDWVEERREAEQIRRRLDAKAKEWVRLGKGSGGLLDEAALPEAERWLANPDATELGYDATLPALVNASQQAIEKAEQEREATRLQELRQAEALAEEQRQRIAEQTRAAKRMRRSMIGLAAVFLVAVAAGLFAWLESQEAQQAEQEAKRLAKAEALARVEAENARLASIAQLLLIQAPQQQDVLADERGALLARQAYHFSATGSRRLRTQVDSILRTVLGKRYFSQILTQKNSEAVAFSSDGSQLASAHSHTDEILLWDLTQPGAMPVVLPGYPGYMLIEGTAKPGSDIHSLAFSPDGKTLIAANADGAIGRWDLDTPQTSFTELLIQEGGVWSLAFSSDGHWLALGNKHNDYFALWDLTKDTAEPVQINDPQALPDGSGPDFTIPGGVPVAFSPDSNTLATGSLNGTIRLWNPRNLSAPVTSLHGHERGLLALVFDATGRRLASSAQDATIRLWNLEQPSKPPIIFKTESPASSIDFDTEGKTLLSTVISGGLQLWSLDNPDAMPITIYNGFLNEALFSPDTKRIASGGAGGAGLRLWHWESSDRSQVLTGHQSTVLAVTFSPDMKLLASGGGTADKTIQLWRWDRLDVPPIILRGTKGAINSLDFNSDGTLLLAASHDENSIRLWDLLKPVPTSIALPGVPNSFAPWTALFSPNTQQIVATGSGGVYAWQLANLTAKPTHLVTSAHWTPGIAFAPGGKTLAVATYSPNIYLQDLNHLDKPAFVLRGHDERGSTSVAFNPDGKMLASGGRDATVRLWNPNAPNQASILLGRHDANVEEVRFSPDGKQLASISQDSSAYLWDPKNLNSVPIVLPGHEGGVWALTYSPDGRHLITGGRDKTIRIWDLNHPLNSSTTQVVADMVCAKVLRNLTLDEWYQFIGEDIPYERTCPNLPIHPSLFEAAEKLAKDDDKDGAVALLERALELDSDLTWNSQEEAERLATSAGQ